MLITPPLANRFRIFYLVSGITLASSNIVAKVIAEFRGCCCDESYILNAQRISSYSGQQQQHHSSADAKSFLFSCCDETDPSGLDCEHGTSITCCCCCIQPASVSGKRGCAGIESSSSSLYSPRALKILRHHQRRCEPAVSHLVF